MKMLRFDLQKFDWLALKSKVGVYVILMLERNHI